MFKLEFRTENAAFEAPHIGDDVAAILRRVAERVEGDGLIVLQGGVVRDINGNRIGEWSYEPSEDGEGRADG